jgi:hypothetical protein
MSRAHQPQRLLLSRKARASRGRQLAGQRFQFFRLAARSERVIEFKSLVEVILDYPFIAPGNKDEMLDTSSAGLIDHVLNYWSVDHS